MTQAVFKLDLLGDKELEKAFAELARINQKKVMRKAQRGAFRIIFDATKRLVPIRFGDLFRGIKLRALQRSRVRSGVVVKLPERDVLKIPANAKGYYPAIIEYGDETQPPNRFMRHAFDTFADATWRRFHRLLWAGVLRAWRGLPV